MIYYNLMTLNAAAMLGSAVVRQQDDTHNYRPEFKYDFNKKYIKNSILENTDLHSDNALFYQIIASQYGHKAVDQYRHQTDCILRSLIYVNFKQVFSDQKETKGKKAGCLPSVSRKGNENDIDAKCSVLFEDGFSLIYEDGEIKTYIPFDKSGNMARNYSITFIDRDLFPDVDCRLRLGIDFSSIHVVLSKYFAYRGLYLTDGVRTAEDADHLLNHTTVLVLEDDTHDYMINNVVQNVPVITADENLLLKGEFKSLEKKHPVRLNSFDGEGLVSPFFAEYMNRSRQQEVYMKRPGVSFQIRMPYIKGMLHQVDFHRFFKEQLSDNDYYIKDIFGIPRRIADVQIVLTKSMFKCAGWLKDYWKIHPEINDPMAWFFDMFHQYDHALYIRNTDSNMGSRKVALTYQFLNTMALEPKELENIINRHLNEAHSISKTGAKYAVDITEHISELLFGEEDKDISSSIPAWRYALDLNSDFVRDPYIKSRLKMDETARIKDVCKGRIIVDGVQKYLSGDLLALLLHMIYNKKVKNDGGIGGENGLGVITKDDGFHIHSEFNKAAVMKLRRQLIRTGKFYTADHARLGLNKNKRYSVLRNPHLSRNEQCSLRPYIPEYRDENNIYNLYFSHLKNVIMLPYESIDAISLGGADYDGDMVKIILDRTVNSAILKGSYTLKGKDYVRKLPIVEIPSLGADREPAPKTISYQLVKNTFSNQVGLISNLAIRIGKLEYAPDRTDSSLDNKCAECTLATGLEIDAAKTGIRPNLDSLKKAAPSGKDYYLKFKEDIEKPTTEGDFTRLKFTLKETSVGRFGGKIFTARKYRGGTRKDYKNLFEAEFIPLDAPAALIDRLPGYMLKDLSGEWKKEAKPEDAGEEKRSEENLLFKFQQDKKWKQNLQLEIGGREKQEKISALIKSYKKALKDAKYIKEEKEKASRSININKIWKLLKKHFDFEAEVLPLTHTSIPDAIEMAQYDIRNIFKTTAEVQEAIERMKNLDWVFAAPEEREALLYQILGSDTLLDETREILLSNDPDAFFFLLYYLQEAKAEILEQTPADEMDLSDQKQYKCLTGYSFDDYKDFFHEYITGQNNKESKRLWNDRIIGLCRNKLAAKNLFNNDFDSALKFYYSKKDTDSQHNFLWEVFKTNEILRNVYIKPKE